MQSRLRDAGFYTGPIDGRFRETTIVAIDAYFNRTR
jgi:peptidoglycan hydrolase-like protein with peptidoglycan-binding domain